MAVLVSERQRDILRRVVEEYVATGQPVGSKTLVERGALGFSPSTVRAELAELERAGLLEEMRAEEIGAYRSLMEALEKRAALLDVLAQRIDPRRSFARVGEELEQPGLRELALVGATYGYAHQTLGAVSLLGPLRMDYEKALHSVRSAAHELSRFVEDVYG